MALKRVVVTGLGALTPIGNNLNDFWTGLVEGKSGAAPITYFDTEKFKTKFACELKNFDVSEHLDRKQQRKMDRFTQYGMVCSEEAIKDSGLDLDKIDKFRVGVIWGSGIGGHAGGESVGGSLVDCLRRLLFLLLLLLLLLVGLALAEGCLFSTCTMSTERFMCDPRA